MIEQNGLVKFGELVSTIAEKSIMVKLYTSVASKINCLELAKAEHL